MENRTKIIIGTIWSQISKFTEFILLFIFSVVLARGLGPNKYGLYVSIIAFLSLFEFISSFGLEQTLSNYTSKYDTLDNIELLSKLLKNVIFVRIITLGLLFVFILMMADFLSINYFRDINYKKYIVIASYYIFFRNLSCLMSFYYISRFEVKIYTIVNTISLLFSLGLVLLIIYLNYDLYYIFLFLGIIYSISFTVYVLFSKPMFMKVKKVCMDSSIWKYGQIIWINNILAYLLGNRSDILIMQWFNIGLVNIGYYNIAYSVVETSSSVLLNGIAIVSLPLMSSIYARDEKNKLPIIWRLIVSFGNCISVPILIFLMCNANIIIATIYSPKYMNAITTLQVFAGFSLVGRLMGGGINTTLLYATNKQKYILYITVFAGIINVFSNIILIKRYGIIGAAIGTGICNLMTTFSIYMYARSKYAILFPSLLTFKVVCSAILSSVISMYIISNNIFSIVFTFLLYGLFYVIMLILLKPFNNDDLEYFRSVPNIHRCLGYISC